MKTWIKIVLVCTVTIIIVWAISIFNAQQAGLTAPMRTLANGTRQFQWGDGTWTNLGK